jgi:hypothetical protein
MRIDPRFSCDLSGQRRPLWCSKPPTADTAKAEWKSTSGFELDTSVETKTPEMANWLADKFRRVGLRRQM